MVTWLLSKQHIHVRLLSSSTATDSFYNLNVLLLHKTYKIKSFCPSCPHSNSSPRENLQKISDVTLSCSEFCCRAEYVKNASNGILVTACGLGQWGGSKPFKSNAHGSQTFWTVDSEKRQACGVQTETLGEMERCTTTYGRAIKG